MSSTNQTASSTVKINDCAVVNTSSMVESERDRKLKRIWSRELKMLERMLRYLFLDVFFRRLTFPPLNFSKPDIRLLADQGFYNIKIKHASCKRYKLFCVFCNFEFSNDKYPQVELNVANITFHHNLQSPYCSIFRMDQGLNFATLDEKLGLINVGMKVAKRDSPQDTKPVTPFFLNAMPRQAPKGDKNRLTCVTCLTNVKNVLTSCNHVTMCSICFVRDRSNSTLCVVCRAPFTWYRQVTLPEPSFGFNRDLQNLFACARNNNVDDREMENIGIYVRMLSSSLVDVSLQRIPPPSDRTTQ